MSNLRSLRAALILAVTAGLILPSSRSDSQMGAVTLMAPLSLTTAADYNAQPVTNSNQPPPQVMLTLSRDNQLHYKAYNDYSDLDENGTLETTYEHKVDYYGYFDAYKCYSYNKADGRFAPDSVNVDKYCSGAWSGNFLNWASMTRLDTMRRLLYGGRRVIDDAGLTVLERSNLPTDAHSWAKYYNGLDIAKLTPFTDIPTAPPRAGSRSSNAMTVDTTHSFVVANGSLGNVSTGDQIKGISQLERSDVFFGYVSRVVVSSVTTVDVRMYSVSNASNPVSDDWVLTNLSQSGISFCNLTWSSTGGTDQFSHTTSQPPLLRVAQGNFELWGANEVNQCYWAEEKVASFYGAAGSNGNIAAQYGLNASGYSPHKGHSGGVRHALGEGSNAGATSSPEGEYIVRVQACAPGLEGRERCKLYPSGVSKKPIGLLQVYGDDDRVTFGLVTPSYTKNISGGVLRKNIGSFSQETKADGSFDRGINGIVSTIDALKMYGYDYKSSGYVGSGANQDGCNFRISELVHSGGTGGAGIAGRDQNEGNCSSWGNPFSEAYLESLRFVAGKDANPDFNYPKGDNKDAQIGLSVVTPKDALDKSNYCANLSVLGINASVSSYDDDQMSGITDLGSSKSAQEWTDIIGGPDGEKIHGTPWFVGVEPDASAAFQGSCIAKSIKSLGAVTGLCPEAPSLLGTYLVAGTAYYAHTNRIRGDTGPSGLNVPADDTTSLKVNTYAVSLATNTPKVVIPVPGGSGRQVTIIPALRTDLDGGGTNFGPGAIVDFRIISQDLAAGTGSFYVNWENSTQGADYDQDIWGVISYAIDAGSSTVKVTTDAIAMSAGTSIGFGYIINGTTKDGLHFHSGESTGGANLDYSDSTIISVLPTQTTSVPPRVFINASGGCQACKKGDPPTTATYTLGASKAGVLKDPLFYAAKYGAFNDSNGNNLPDLVSEWDARKSDGSLGSDGLPDTYFLVSNPSALETALGAALSDIISRAASGSAAAVVSNTREGQGAIYQALYEPNKVVGDRRASWVGTLQSLWIDKLGRIREDGDGDAQLDEDSFAQDPLIEVFYDPDKKSTRLRRFSGDVGSSSEEFDLANIRPIWNARKQLSAVSNVRTQREYKKPADTGRYLFTAQDNGWDGRIETTDAADFVPANFTGGRFGLLNVSSATEAEKLVEYIRGTDFEGLRNRTLDYDSDGTPEVQRLGDIVQSTPTPVGAPGESYNLLYSDQTYTRFVNQYQNRRTVVYAGGNDGVLHAFNGGFFDPANKKFTLQSTKKSETQHPLGSELWGYVPYNLLPHLRWLSNPNYGHIYYMDGRPQVFDARIFTSTGDGGRNPYGWGTVMVVGMRLGGGELTLPTRSGTTTTPAFSGFGTAPPATVTTRSAYVLLDITDPEAPPRLLAEISDPNLGFTTGQPALVAFSKRGNTTTSSFTDEQWYLVFGNGPSNANVASGLVSSRAAGLYVYDLKNKAFASGWAPRAVGATASFVGDPASVDWNLDFKGDALYFGTVGGTPAAPTGGLFKVPLNNAPLSAGWSAPQRLLDTRGPVTAAPSTAIDEADRHWVYGGTGQFYANADKPSSAPQGLYGVIDDDSGKEVDYDSLVDTTNAVVTSRTGAISGVSGATSETALIALAADPSRRGWKLRLNTGASAPAERIVSRTSLFGEILFATAFTPSATICAGEGLSRLLGIFYKTGAARSTVATFGTRTTTVGGAEVTSVVRDIELGRGLASGVSLHVDTGGSITTTQLTAIAQTSTAAITANQATVGTLASSEVDWRDSRRVQ